MITQDKIDRINALAKKAKEEGLTPEEIAERDVLRQEYIAAFRENLRAQLENIKFVDEVSEEVTEMEEEISDDIDKLEGILEKNIDNIN